MIEVVEYADAWPALFAPAALAERMSEDPAHQVRRMLGRHEPRRH